MGSGDARLRMCVRSPFSVTTSGTAHGYFTVEMHNLFVELSVVTRDYNICRHPAIFLLRNGSNTSNYQKVFFNV